MIDPNGHHPPIPAPDGSAVAQYRREVADAVGADDPGFEPAEKQVACLLVAAEIHCASCDYAPDAADLTHMVEGGFHALALAFLRVAWRQFADAEGLDLDRKDITDASPDD